MRGPGFDSWLCCAGHFFPLFSRRSLASFYFNICSYTYIFSKDHPVATQANRRDFLQLKTRQREGQSKGRKGKVSKTSQKEEKKKEERI